MKKIINSMYNIITSHHIYVYRFCENNSDNYEWCACVCVCEFYFIEKYAQKKCSKYNRPITHMGSLFYIKFPKKAKGIYKVELNSWKWYSNEWY